MSAYIPTKRWRKRQKNRDSSSEVGENEVKTNQHIAKETKSKKHFYQPPGVMSGGFLDTATYNPEDKTVSSRIVLQSVKKQENLFIYVLTKSVTNFIIYMFMLVFSNPLL